MAGLPLLQGYAPDAPFAYRRGVAIPVRQFLHHALALARELPDGGKFVQELQSSSRFTPKSPELIKEYLREVGIDVVGAAPVEPYEETERHIRDRRERGLFARMRFTMAQPEVSCHPETLLPGRAPPRTV